MTEKLILIFIVIGLLLIAPISAKEITSKADDKKIIHSYGDSFYFIHAADFGDIEVMEKEYQRVFIGDNVTFNTESTWGHYRILKVNGVDLNVI